MSTSSGGSVGRVALIALFVTALMTAQVTASKVLAVPVPWQAPYLGAVTVGGNIVLPGAALAYALTFFATDCYGELYGRRAAQVVVNVAFVMNFVLLALVWATILAPAAQDSVNPRWFAVVLGASTNIVAGSLLAYLVSQNWDVLVFHRLRKATEGDFLWLRNLVSTATSQAIDTVIFVGVAFYLLPKYGPFGSPAPPSTVVALVAGQYLLKLLIAVVDTPFVYAVVGIVRSRADSAAVAAARTIADESREGEPER